MSFRARFPPRGPSRSNPSRTRTPGNESGHFMVAHPILINRPVVFTPLGARLCRPSETVLEILPEPQRGAFAKEDGEVVVYADGRRAGRG